jgi:septum site-determining protein MinC
MKLKGEMSMLNALYVSELDVEKICTEIEKKRDEAPQFFMQSPIIVDCAELGEKVTEFDFSALKKGLLDLGFIPVGVRNVPDSLSASLSDSGWAVMRATQDSAAQKPEAEAVVEGGEVNADDSNKQEAETASISSITVGKPVRSGQQIYAASADMTVLAPTSAGSEVMADGSIHVYGAIRGRVLAGARGNTSARIFCQSLQAELIAIAGRYQLLDESDTELKGKPAMIHLDGEKLVIEPLAS